MAGSISKTVKSGMQYTVCFTVLRKIFSAFITLSSLALILYAIGNGYAALPGPIWLHYLLLFSMITLLGYLEGLQVAILQLEKTKLPQDLPNYFRAKATHELATRNHGMNVQRFLIGRQFFVVFVVFITAQLTTFPDLPRGILPDWLFSILFDTGFCGVLVVLSFGQLMPQLVAATHPLTVMNLPGSWTVVQMTLVLETIGVAHFSWVLADLVKCLGKLDTNESIETSNNKVMDVDISKDTVKGSNGECVIVVEGPAEDFGSDINKLETYARELHIPNLSPTSCHDTKVIHDAGVAGLEPVSIVQVGPKIVADMEKGLPPWLHTSSREKFKSWGIDAISGKAYPSPAALVEQLQEAGESLPRYLLPPSHPKHIPPHLVAFDLFERIKAGKDKSEDEIKVLKTRISTLEEKIKAYTQNHSDSNMSIDGSQIEIS